MKSSTKTLLVKVGIALAAVVGCRFVSRKFQKEESEGEFEGDLETIEDDFGEVTENELIEEDVSENRDEEA